MDGADGHGVPYVFQWDGASWNELDKLSSPDAHQDAGFGHAVAVSGDLMVIEAYHDSETLDAAGAAYVFWWDGVEWVSMERLEAVDAAEHDEFGYAVGLSGATAVVGGHRHSHGLDSAGAAYVY